MVRDFLVGLPNDSAPALGEYGVALALEGLLPAQAGGVTAYVPITADGSVTRWES